MGVVTFFSGGSLFLSRGRFFRGVVTFDWGRYFRVGVVYFGGVVIFEYFTYVFYSTFLERLLKFFL